MEPVVTLIARIQVNRRWASEISKWVLTILEFPRMTRARCLSVLNFQPKFDGPHRPQPLGGALGRGSSMLIFAKFSDGGQSGLLCLSHGNRRVGSRLLGGQTFQQYAGFVFRADRSNFQDRSAVLGLYEASLTARLCALSVKLSRIGQAAALVDGTLKRVSAGLVPAGKTQIKPALFRADEPCGHSWTVDNDRAASCGRRLEDRHSRRPFAPDRNAKRAGHGLVGFAVSGSNFLNNPEDRPVLAGRSIFPLLARGAVATVLAVLWWLTATTGKRNVKQSDACERKYRFHIVLPIFDRILPAKMTANGRLAEVS
jgi:hypothetical protein